MESLGFSSFRQLMDDWDNQVLKEANEDKIEALLDSLGLVLFFEKDNEIFGSGEDSRVIFAKLKNPDDELPAGWADEANFTAHNLSKLESGEISQHVFNKENLDQIKIIDRDQACEKIGNKMGDVDIEIKHTPHRTPDKDSDQAPNFIQAKEKD